jgi:hypothetical protein
MVRRILSLCLVVAALLTIAPLAPAPSLGRVVASETKECTVYVTRTGAKYHRATCSSLRYSRRAMTRSEAIAAGYTACKRCGGSACEN